MINAMQENELALETLAQREQKLKRDMDKKYVTQNANRTKLQKNIAEANAALQVSKKKIKEGTILMQKDDNPSHANKKKGPDADKVEVDVDKMLEQLRSKIVDIYKKQFVQTEVSGKKTIDLLNVSSQIYPLTTAYFHRKSNTELTRA